MDFVETLLAFIGTLVSILLAIAKLYGEIRDMRHQVNSRLDQQLDLTAKASFAAGQLAGPDAPAAGPVTDKASE